MNVWRCVICGDSYIGTGRPTHCPFCGAHINHMVEIEKWTDLNKGLQLTNLTKDYVTKALEIELSNASFYEAAAEKVKAAGDDEARSIFRALFKVEAEHASVFKKMLKDEVPDIKVEETAFDTVRENFEESLRREEKATKFYAAANLEATETRAKQVFEALVEVESDHIALDKQHLGIKETEPVT